MLDRRAFLSGLAGLTATAITLPALTAPAAAGTPQAGDPQDAAAADGRFRQSTVAINGITMHLTEQGPPRGRPVLFVHGFPDTAATWRAQMAAVAAAGYRALAPDMRGYGQTSAPPAASQYTPLQLVGDLVGLLDALRIPSATIVGHDWGAYTAHQAALLRPDRFPAVFGMSFPYAPRDSSSSLDKIRASGAKYFYIFDQIKPEADAKWADAALTIPSALYWASHSPPAAIRWDPFDPTKSLLRPAPTRLPEWIDRRYLAANIEQFDRTGFHGGLNYYRAIQLSWELTAPWYGATINQPSLYLFGAVDGLNKLGVPTIRTQRPAQPGLLDVIELPNVGHWVQHEAVNAVNNAVLHFLDETRRCSDHTAHHR